MAVRHHLLGFATAVISSLVMAQSPRLVDQGTQVVLGRYTTQAAAPAPDLAAPLDLVAQLSFPRGHVSTIGDAVRYTLMRTGYTLVDPASMAPEAARFLQLPLPEAQRELGPYKVQAILDVLLGSAWTSHSDPIQRRVWFTVNPAYASLIATASTAAAPSAASVAALPVAVEPAAPAATTASAPAASIAPPPVAAVPAAEITATQSLSPGEGVWVVTHIKK